MSNAAISPPVIARLLLPDDANLSGNVHGGTILQLMEQAGMISAASYFNKPSTYGNKNEYEGKQHAGLARIETMSFHQPVFVGEVVYLSTELLFTSEHSVIVKVVVSAENPTTSTQRVTNSGLLWYLSFVDQVKKGPLAVSVPQMLPPEGGRALDEYNKVKTMYETRKHNKEAASSTNGDACLEMEGCLCAKCRAYFKPADNAKSPSESTQMLSQMVLPGDCGVAKIAFGGFVMKLMDTAAGCCAHRHARTNVVTVSIGAMDFVSMVYLGDIVTIAAKINFCSAKSMEIAVSASVTSMIREDHPVAKGIFSFVSLDEKNKVQPVPPLKFETEAEFDEAFKGQQRYEATKRERLAAKSK